MIKWIWQKASLIIVICLRIYEFGTMTTTSFKQSEFSHTSPLTREPTDIFRAALHSRSYFYLVSMFIILSSFLFSFFIFRELRQIRQLVPTQTFRQSPWRSEKDVWIREQRCVLRVCLFFWIQKVKTAFYSKIKYY